MNNYEFIKKEIRTWGDEALITPELEQTLLDRYSGSGVKNPLRAVLAAIGGIFVLAGATVILVSMWADIPYAVRRILAFCPLVLSQIVALVCFYGNKNTSAVREGVSLFCAAGIFSSYKLIELVFETPTDFSRYILLCGLMLLPVIIVFRSVLTSAFYLYAVVSWGDLSVAQEGFTAANIFKSAILLFAVAAGIAITVLNSRGESRIIKTVALWIASAGAVTAIGFVAGILGIPAGTAIMLTFAVMLASGKSDDISAPFYTAGTIGSITTLLLTLAGAFATTNPAYNTLPVYIVTAAGITALLVVICIRSDKNPKKIVTGLAVAITAGVTLLAVGRYSFGPEAPVFISLPVAVCTVATGITYLTAGIKNNALSDLNVGFITLAVTGGCFFAGSEMSTFLKGALILILGIVFLILNILFSKRGRKKDKEAV